MVANFDADDWYHWGYNMYNAQTHTVLSLISALGALIIDNFNWDEL